MTSLSNECEYFGVFQARTVHQNWDPARPNKNMSELAVFFFLLSCGQDHSVIYEAHESKSCLVD